MDRGEGESHGQRWATGLRVDPGLPCLNELTEQPPGCRLGQVRVRHVPQLQPRQGGMIAPILLVRKLRLRENER